MVNDIIRKINGLPRLLISRYYLINILPNILKRKYIHIFFNNFICNKKCEICRKCLSPTDYIFKPKYYKVINNNNNNTTNKSVCLKCNNTLELKKLFKTPYINYSNILLPHTHIFLTVGNGDYMGLDSNEYKEYKDYIIRKIIFNEIIEEYEEYNVYELKYISGVIMDYINEEDLEEDENYDIINSKDYELFNYNVESNELFNYKKYLNKII